MRVFDHPATSCPHMDQPIAMRADFSPGQRKRAAGNMVERPDLLQDEAKA